MSRLDEPEWWEVPGFSRGLTEALRRHHRAEDRPPTDADRPPASTFPMTPAARAALRYRRESKARANGAGGA